MVARRGPAALSFVLLALTGALLLAGLTPSASAARPGPATSPAAVPRVTAAGGGPAGAHVVTSVENGSGWLNLTSSLHGNAANTSFGTMFYDPSLSADVLVPGTNDLIGFWYAFANDTWKQYSGSSPAPLLGTAGAWDPALNEGVVFGGETTSAQNYLCTLAATTWHCSYPGAATAPAARWGEGLAWDPSDGYLLLFGGENGTARFNDTWVYEGSTWTHLNLSVAPAARFGAVMVEDPRLDGVLLFGGNGSGGVLLNDTWLFQNGGWRPLTGTVAPPTRTEAYGAYDAPTSSVVVFGGLNSTGGPEQDAWFFANGSWSGGYPPTYPTPLARSAGVLAPAPSGNGLLLFAGLSGTHQLNDTWLFYTINPQVVSSPLDGEGAFAVTFAASALGGAPPLTFFWSFGDGSAATGLSEVHYFSIGRYLVQLTVTDEYGVQGHYNLTVADVVPFTFSARLSPTLGPVPLHLAGTSTPANGATPYSIHWTFAGGPRVDGASAATVYTVPGRYTVNVWGNDSFGWSFHQSFVVLAETPVGPPLLNVSVVANRTAGIAPAPFAFAVVAPSTPAPTTFAWSFGDGGTAIGALVSHTFATAGAYPVTVIATTATGAEGVASTTVVVGPPISIQVAYLVTNGTAGELLHWNASAAGGISPYRYFWQLGGGIGAEGPTVTALYNRTGEVRVSVEVVDAAGNHATVSTNVSVVAPGTLPGRGGAATPAPLGTVDLLAGAAVVGFVAGALGALAAFRTRLLRPPAPIRRGRTGRARRGPSRAVHRGSVRPWPPNDPRSPPDRTPAARPPPGRSG